MVATPGDATTSSQTHSVVSKPNAPAGAPSRRSRLKVGCFAPSWSSVDMTQTIIRRETTRQESNKYIHSQIQPVKHRPAETSNANL